MIILGLNAYHGDSAACLVRDGEIVAAAEEERFRRIKHWAGFPSEAIGYCLAEAGVDARRRRARRHQLRSAARASCKKVGYAMRQRPDSGSSSIGCATRPGAQSIEAELAAAFPATPFRGKVHRVEHHLAHLASAFLVSPFEEATVVSVDGFGDFASAAWGIGRGTTIDVEGRVYFPHSLGIFYQALTQYLGFPHYGDEYKVMGLAPYGEPAYLAEMRQIVRLQRGRPFRARHSPISAITSEQIAYAWAGGSPHVGDTVLACAGGAARARARGQDEPLEDRHRDIARSVQAMYEEAFFHLIEHLHASIGWTAWRWPAAAP